MTKNKSREESSSAELLSFPVSETEENAPPDGGVWGWLAVCGCFINFFLIYGYMRVFTVLINPLSAYFNVSLKMISLIYTVCSVGLICGSLVGGTLIEKLGIRKSGCIFGLLNASTFVMAYLSKENFYLVVSSIVLNAFCSGIIFLGTVKAISLYFDKKRTLANQIGTCGTSVGQFIFGPALAFFIEEYGMNSTFLILAGIFLNFLVSAALFRTPEGKSKEQEKVKFDPEVFKIPAFQLFLLAQIILLAGYLGSIMFVAPFAAEKHNASPIQSAYLVSIMAATELVGRLPWGILADKPGMNRHFLLSLDCLGMGVAFFAIPFLPNYTTIACLYGFSGFFQGAFGGLTFVTLGDLLKVQGKQAQLIHCMGINTALTSVGTAIFPILFTLLVPSNDNSHPDMYMTVQILCSCLLLLASLLTFLISLVSSSSKRE